MSDSANSNLVDTVTSAVQQITGASRPIEAARPERWEELLAHLGRRLAATPVTANMCP